MQPQRIHSLARFDVAHFYVFGDKDPHGFIPWVNQMVS
jgi:hypothetical protein